MPEFIYTMKRARKAVGDKVILDDVTMSFYPGAKIGVVGPNGAGKSTILKIMAGLDTPSNGEAFLTPGFSVGILMQEPHLDETQDRAGEHPGGVRRDQRQAGALQRDRRADGHRLLRCADGGDGHPAGGPRPRRRLGPGRPDRPGHGRVALPARRRVGRRSSPAASAAGSRCANCCCPPPTCCCSTSRPTTWTPSRCSGSSSSWPPIPAPSSP